MLQIIIIHVFVLLEMIISPYPLKSILYVLIMKIIKSYKNTIQDVDH
jgi:hypothetical protein